MKSVVIVIILNIILIVSFLGKGEHKTQKKSDRSFAAMDILN
ncbi:MAG: hypothetical protein QF441_12670 [Bacteriovoracaceae bacterium]|jgi:hypothetical protein|nr:hypothetical protein [Bacteriovoracaceae bacterium]|tara:strand:- start:379 stop:504 length:126 start_codon:yes stop_codon:yes gene_type:complete